MDNMKRLLPPALVVGTVSIVAADVCFPVDTLQNMFKNHQRPMIRYEVVPKLNDLILQENDDGFVPFDPILNLPDYRHRYSCRLYLERYTSAYVSQARLFSIEVLFAIYNSCYIIKGYYDYHRRYQKDLFIESVYVYIKNMNYGSDTDRKSLIILTYVQPMLEMVLVLCRKMIGEHTPQQSYLEMGTTIYGELTLGGMISMYNEYIGSPLSQNQIRQVIIGNCYNRDSEPVEPVCLTKANYHRLCCLVKKGRTTTDLVNLKMLVVNSPSKIGCDIYKLPDDLIVMIGQFLHPYDHLVQELIRVKIESPKGGEEWHKKHLIQVNSASHKQYVENQRDETPAKVFIRR